MGREVGWEYGSEPFGSIRGGEFCEKLAEKYQFLDEPVMELEGMLNQSNLFAGHVDLIKIQHRNG